MGETLPGFKHSHRILHGLADTTVPIDYPFGKRSAALVKSALFDPVGRGRLICAHHVDRPLRIDAIVPWLAARARNCADLMPGPVSAAQAGRTSCPNHFDGWHQPLFPNSTPTPSVRDVHPRLLKQGRDFAAESFPIRKVGQRALRRRAGKPCRSNWQKLQQRAQSARPACVVLFEAATPQARRPRSSSFREKYEPAPRRVVALSKTDRDRKRTECNIPR